MILLHPGKLPKRIAAIANGPAAPEVPFGGPHTPRIRKLYVHRLIYMIFSPKVGGVPATNMGYGCLYKSRLQSRHRRFRVRVLETPWRRDSRIESSEGLCTDTE